MKGKPSQYTWDSLAFAILGGVGILFLAGPIIADKTLFGSDFVLQFFPWKNFVYEQLRSDGTFPFWNPYIFSGTPFITNMQASMFYPLGFLYYLIPVDVAYGYSTILHCILGCIFMYAFMRSLSVSAMGSVASAVVFVFNGYFLGHLYAGHLTFTQNYIWIPLIFLYLHRFFREVRFRHAAGAGIILGIQILGGFPQIAFYTILGILAFGLYFAWLFLRNGGYSSAFKVVSGLGVILFLGFAISAVQVLPTLEFAALSTRAGGLNYDFATYHSLIPAELLAFLIPDIFGSVIDGTYWRSPEGWHSLETCAYVGLLPLFLAFIRTEDKVARRIKLFFILLCIVSLFLALGKYNPLYPLIYKLPGFRSFRIPAQIIFLYIFGIGVIAGLGFQQVQEGAWKFSRGASTAAVLLGTLFLLLLAGHFIFPYDFYLFLFNTFSESPVGHADMSMLYRRMGIGIEKGALVVLILAALFVMRKRGRLNGTLFGILAVTVLLVDLYLFGAQFVQPYAFTPSSDKEKIISQLNRNPAKGRVLTRSDLFMPNDGLQYRFPTIEGYDPLLLKRYLHYIRFSQGYAQDDHVIKIGGGDLKFPGAKLLKMLNLRQMVLGREVVETDNGLPYATLVGRAIVKPVEEILPFMAGEAFDPRKVVVLETEDSTRRIKHDVKGTPRATCVVEKYENERIGMKVTTDKNGYLVLSEMYYPGWKAFVDGKEVPVLRGNYLFRVIPLEKGEHEVRLFFVSWPFRIGAVVSILAFVFSLCLVLWPRRNGTPLPSGRSSDGSFSM